ncbi:jg24664 [Pararge aegeria aegeria]|uniref:Jg24664 protein n=1 Tax=Pararge aegeria aegeria TaxID=348720 RepID=A0A8S4R2L5_9NEOP|nr:jg24664 [Pararge aegeria aegeria]
MGKNSYGQKVLATHGGGFHRQGDFKGRFQLVNLSGIQFLKHAERCRGLIFLLDGTNDPRGQYRSLSHELAHYSEQLAQRPRCVVLNKTDVAGVHHVLADLRKTMDVVGISAKTGSNLGELLKVIRRMYDEEDDAVD